MQANNVRRLVKELNNERLSLQNNEFFGVFYYPTKIDNWKAFINGPDDSPFENHSYELSIQFPDHYPFKPPVVRFITQICPPNVSQIDGLVSVNFLDKSAWSPAIDTRILLHMIQGMLDSPGEICGADGIVSIPSDVKYKEEAHLLAQQFGQKPMTETDIDQLTEKFEQAFEQFANIQLQ